MKKFKNIEFVVFEIFWFYLGFCRKFKWLVKDLEANIFDVDDGHLNDSTEQKNDTDWTLEEYKQWLQNLKKR